ncbi:MAG TPA: molybdenum cofactor guanylyltransferase [Pyrinomonadaceae bacterium]|jgi:molybdopterin-guanine dinucleotide biosynthesis protein A
MPDIEGFILAGGASSRMGADKALLELGGRNFVERIGNALAAVTSAVTLVGVKADNASWPLRRVADIHVNWGALGGLHAALANCGAEWAAVVACDLPFVTGELFVRLGEMRGDFDAVVPIQEDGRPQPLCALYRTRPCGQLAEELVRAGERRPRALLERVRTRRVAFAELAHLEGANSFFTNVNTPGDYADAREKEGEKQG